MKPAGRHEGQSLSDRILLREIVESDLEILRTQKNLHRASFFYQEEISKSQQNSWYAGYASDPNNLIFMLEMDGIPVGCIGLRRNLENLSIDFYNLMTWSTGRGSGAMHSAILRIMEEQRQLFQIRSFGVDVLVDNPAVTWYEKVGFLRVDVRRDDSGLPYVRLEISYPVDQERLDFR